MPRPNNTAMIIEATAIIHAAKDGEDKQPTFTALAYTGAMIDLAGWTHPVAIDMAGITWTEKPRPILRDHNPSRIVGHTSTIEMADDGLMVSGVISGGGADADEVRASGKNGFPWQMSIGAQATKTEFLKAEKITTVNGRKIEGPAYIVREARLNEISFVALGADDATSAEIAAQRANENGDEKMEPNEQKAEVEKTEPQMVQMKSDEAINEIRAEKARMIAIDSVCPDAEIKAKAVADGWTPEQAELAYLKAEKARGENDARIGSPAIHVADTQTDSAVLASAVCKAAGVDDIADEKTLEARDRAFRAGIGPMELAYNLARANGYHGRTIRGNESEIIRAAFSTKDFSGILSNVANKSIKMYFERFEDSWRKIAAIGTASDFKKMSSYSLTSGAEYKKIAPNGEIEHAEMGETSYTNQVDTYARLFALTRQDIVNDDAGAFARLGQHIGRGGALGLNKIFWTAFLDNSTFFASGNNNYETGAATALGIDSLTTAETTFYNQTTPDGDPLGVDPRVLLVPTALNNTATSLMSANEVRNTTASAKYPVANPHAGKYDVVRSSYLSNASYTGHSAAAWYLLADPMDMPVIEIAFLNGVQTPTVESADTDFNTLGVQFRGYFDFGVSLMEYRGGVKMKGEA